MIICIKGQKIGDSVILTESGKLQCIWPETFYPRNVEAYFMLKQRGNNWNIERMLIK